MTNPIKDKHGVVIKEGDAVRYYDSTAMWLTSKIIDVGSALAIITDENPIPLYEFVQGYVYDGSPIPEIEVVKPEAKTLNNRSRKPDEYEIDLSTPLVWPRDDDDENCTSASVL